MQSEQCQYRRRMQGGFTWSELLAVLTIMWLIVMVAIPAMRTFTNRNHDVGAATRLSNNINRLKDQARRRNRAYVVDFRIFLQGEPAGRVDFVESASSSCQATAEDEEIDTTTVLELPFGLTEIVSYNGPKERDVGLRGWRSDGGAERTDRLRLCIGPDGAVSLINGQAVSPLTGRLQVLVQAFDRADGNWRFFGPSRRVELTFAGPARLAVD